MRKGFSRRHLCHRRYCQRSTSRIEASIVVLANRWRKSAFEFILISITTCPHLPSYTFSEEDAGKCLQLRREASMQQGALLQSTRGCMTCCDIFDGPECLRSATDNARYIRGFHSLSGL